MAPFFIALNRDNPTLLDPSDFKAWRIVSRETSAKN